MENREIKFRAWDKKNKKMRVVNTISFHCRESSFDYDPSGLPKAVSVWGWSIIEYKDILLNRDSKQVIIQQYTGFKDKKEKEIYEGDIIESDYKNIRYVVVFNNGSYALRHLTHGSHIWGALFIMMDNPDFNIEVIGNIHQNPELLKTE